MEQPAPLVGVSSSKCHHVLFFLFFFIPLSQMLVSSCWAMTTVPAPGQLCATALGLPQGMQRPQGMGPTALCLYYRSAAERHCWLTAQHSVCGKEKQIAIKRVGTTNKITCTLIICTCVPG